MRLGVCINEHRGILGGDTTTRASRPHVGHTPSLKVCAITSGSRLFRGEHRLLLDPRFSLEPLIFSSAAMSDGFLL